MIQKNKPVPLRGARSGKTKKEENKIIRKTAKKKKNTTAKKNKTGVKKMAVKSRFASAKAITDKKILADQEIFNLDHFLIDEQLIYSERLNERQDLGQKNFTPVINELDKLISSSKTKMSKLSSKNELASFLPKHLKISINKNGEVKKEESHNLANSLYTLDLNKAINKKSEVASKKTIDFKEEFKVTMDEFKVEDENFEIPKTSLIKKVKLKEKFNIRFLALKNRFPQRSAEFSNISRLQRFKMTLNFALVALVLILPIRAIFFYQHFEKTKGQVLGISEEAWSELEQATQAASQSNWQEAGLYFDSASNYFSLAKDNLTVYNQALVNIAKNLPAAGSLVVSTENLLESGRHLSNAASNISQAINQTAASKDINQTLTDNLSIISVALKQAQSEISLALNYLSAVSSKIIPEQYRKYFVELQSQLPALEASLTQVQSFLDFSLKVLGHQAEQRYLFLFQNNNELRATGGFLGSAALVDLKNGEIINMEVPGGGLYDLKGDFFEKVISPVPMHLLGTPWMIWDANWWADFPTSAQKITWFWEKSGWPTVDGVITFNSSLMPKLLEIVGDIAMPEYDQILTPENVVLALQHEVEFEFDPAENKPKKIIGELMPILIGKLLETPTKQALPLLLTLNQALTEKEIQFYFTSPELEKFVKEAKWAGEVQGTEKDYLMVVNQNIAGGKSDSVISQEIKHYSYLQADGSIIDTVAITRTNNGNPEDVFERVQNNSYIRVYVPKGSRLLEVTGYNVIDPKLFKEVYEGYRADEYLQSISGQINKDAKTNTDVYSEFNKEVFGNWLQIKPGESKTITFSYKLPFVLNFESESILKKNQSQKYSLLVQSQSGANQTSFSSQLFLPSDFEVTWSGGTLDNQPIINNNQIIFEADLKSDVYYGVLINQL